jgi:hypothetical protein
MKGNLLFNTYWMENDVANSKLFESSELSEALSFTESLRKRKYAGEEICFITLSSELPNVVGKQGVDVVGPDYDWKKRRI